MDQRRNASFALPHIRNTDLSVALSPDPRSSAASKTASSPPTSSPENSPNRRRVRWDYTVFFATLHVLSLLVLLPALFSWPGVVAFLVGVVVFGQLAIPIGYHRLLSHRSFRTPKWFERVLVTFAMCAAQETPAHWVAWHRMHHSHSDQPEDPHSPRRGPFWAHVQWLCYESRSKLETFSMYQKYARDILADPYYRWIERLPAQAGILWILHAVIYAVVATLGCLAWFGATGEAYRVAASLFVWGVIARTVWVWHITWSVNSISHLFGYRNYATNDDSRNNWFVTLLTAGEGWHNNHHEDPASASVQHRWWEIDINYYVIRLFGLLGLATQIVPPRHRRKRQ